MRRSSVFSLGNPKNGNSGLLPLSVLAGTTRVSTPSPTPATIQPISPPPSPTDDPHHFDNMAWRPDAQTTRTTEHGDASMDANSEPINDHPTNSSRCGEEESEEHVDVSGDNSDIYWDGTDDEDDDGGGNENHAKDQPRHNDDNNKPKRQQEAAEEGEGEEDDEPQRMAVRHPDYADIEQRLGDPSSRDGWCYLCEQIAEVDVEALPREVNELMRFISTKRRNAADQVAFAAHVKHKFETLIRIPANANGVERVGEWTLRSVYAHITTHDGSIEAILERNIQILHRMVRTAEQCGLYSTVTRPARKRARHGGNHSGGDLEVDPKKMAVLHNIIKTINGTAVLRERICSGLDTGATSRSSSTQQAADVRMIAEASGGGSGGMGSMRGGANGKGNGGRMRQGTTTSVSLSTLHAATQYHGMKMPQGSYSRHGPLNS